MKIIKGIDRITIVLALIAMIYTCIGSIDALYKEVMSIWIILALILLIDVCVFY